MLCAATIVPDPETPGMCRQCRRAIEEAPGPFVKETHPLIVASRAYGGELTRAIEAVKMKGHRHTATTLARTLLRPLYIDLIARWEPGTSYALVPVPASVSGRRQRGFDQALVMARELNGCVLPVVIRQRGAAQKTLNRELRLENAVRQYQADPCFKKKKAALPSRVIIIDDVVTTGASIRRCADIVRELGVSEWYAIALALRL